MLTTDTPYRKKLLQSFITSDLEELAILKRVADGLEEDRFVTYSQFLDGALSIENYSSDKKYQNTLLRAYYSQIEYLREQITATTEELLRELTDLNAIAIEALRK